MPAQRGMAYGVISSAYFVGNSTGPIWQRHHTSVGVNLDFSDGNVLAIDFLWVWLKVPDVGQEAA